MERVGNGEMVGAIRLRSCPKVKGGRFCSTGGRLKVTLELVWVLKIDNSEGVLSVIVSICAKGKTKFPEILVMVARRWAPGSCKVIIASSTGCELLSIIVPIMGWEFPG